MNLRPIPPIASAIGPLLALACTLALSLACGQTGSGTAATPTPPVRSTAEVTSPPPTAAPSPAPDPNPTPVTRGYAVVTGSAGAGRFSVSLVGADGTVAAAAQGELHAGFNCGDQPLGAIAPLPALSFTSSRAYFLDGSLSIRFLAPNGASGVATRVPGGPQLISFFAVSPDDLRIAVNVIDYSRLPVSQRLYVEDLAGGANHVEVFSSTGSGPIGSQVVWPVGWRSGNLVLAYVPSTCTQGGGPGLGRPTSFHVSDATSGRRVATIGTDQGGCAMVDAQPSALACTSYQNDAQLFDWQGNRRQALSCPDGLGSLSPDGAKLLCGVFSAKSSFVLGLDGSRIELAGAPAQGGFLDSDHLFLASSAQQTQARIVTLSTNQAKSLTISGDFRGRLPGTLEVGRGT